MGGSELIMAIGEKTGKEKNAAAGDVKKLSTYINPHQILNRMLPRKGKLTIKKTLILD